MYIGDTCRKEGWTRNPATRYTDIYLYTYIHMYMYMYMYMYLPPPPPLSLCIYIERDDTCPKEGRPRNPATRSSVSRGRTTMSSKRRSRNEERWNVCGPKTRLSLYTILPFPRLYVEWKTRGGAAGRRNNAQYSGNSVVFCNQCCAG